MSNTDNCRPTIRLDKDDFFEDHTLSSSSVDELINPVDDSNIIDDTDSCDFSRIESPEHNPNSGMFIVRPANQVVEEAKNRPARSRLFGQLWYEGETCILFADTNLGKSILAVQIADSISSGRPTLGLAMDAPAQKVLICDFELSDKQFEKRYSNVSGGHYQFSPNLLRVEINPDAVDYPESSSFEDYLKVSLVKIVEEYDAKVLIIDNITFLSRENEKAKDALSLMKWLKALGVKYGLSILILAHTPKRNLSNPITRNDLAGSKMIINFCDSSFAIGESTKDPNIRYIKEIKQRNEAFKYDAGNVIVCEVEKPDTFLQFRFMEYGNESEHLIQAPNTTREELVNRAKELSAQGKTQREIATELGKSLGTINNYLNS